MKSRNRMRKRICRKLWGRLEELGLKIKINTTSGRGIGFVGGLRKPPKG
jgi:hypothetical protein